MLYNTFCHIPTSVEILGTGLAANENVAHNAQLVGVLKFNYQHVQQYN